VATKTTHPSYPNPTIVEALCEVHFRLPPEKPWKASLPGEFFKCIQDDYPEMEPLQEMGLQFEIGPLGLGQKILPPRPRMRFKHASRPLLVQLAENVLTVNVLAPYPGWDTMSRDVLDVWRRAEEVLKPSAITRIGLRYINRIERQSAEDHPGDWLRANEYIAPAVLRSAPAFLSRVEAHLDAENRIVVTLGNQPPAAASGYGAIIFDIDLIIERELPPEQNVLSSEMNRLHEHVWQVFVSAKGDKLERLLKGRRS